MKKKQFNERFGATGGCTLCLAQFVESVREGVEEPG
jgi:hypothetical protein